MQANNPGKINEKSTLIFLDIIHTSALKLRVQKWFKGYFDLLLGPTGFLMTLKKHNRILKIFILILSLGTNSAYSQLNFQILPFPDSLSVSALAVNDQGYIFVTTCCLFTDDGIFKSVDGGQTWECLVASVYNYDFRDIKINPDGVLYAIANNAIGDSALLKSSDNGETWIKSIIPGEGQNQKLFLTGGDTIYVSQTSNGALLLRSVNGGVDWEILYPNEGKTSESITDLVIDELGNIYISLFGYIGTAGGVYKSEDFGLTWEVLGLLSSQVTDLEFNSLGDLLISVRSASGPLAGIFVIYHGTEDIVEIFGSAFTSGLVINSGGDIFAGDNFQNGIYHSNDGETFEFITPVMPGDCPISNLYLDSQQFLYSFMFGTSFISKSISSTITSSDLKSDNDEPGIYVDPTGRLLYVFMNNYINEELTYRVFDSKGLQLTSGHLSVSSKTFRIPLPHISRGIYFLQLVSKKDWYSAKFIK